MPNSSENTVGESVFVRDPTFAWLPAQVLDIDSKQCRALVEIQLSPHWETSTTLPENNNKNHDTNEKNDDNGASMEQRWVQLNDYPGDRLPRRHDTVVRDMADLPHLHEAAMLYQLKEKHTRSKPYTRVGEIVVAVNPCHWISHLYTDETQRAYAEHLVWGAGRHSSTNKSNNCSSEEKKDEAEESVGTTSRRFEGDYSRLGHDPHVYEVSSFAYRGLVEDSQSQAILVSGESGAGKTETVKIVLWHLSRLPEWHPSAPFKDSSSSSSHSLVTRVMASVPIFEAFGNARTRRNHNSSRFGKVTRLNFCSSNDDGAYLLRGAQTDTYLLEKSRVVSHPPGERSFHIFYQLLSAPPADKVAVLGPQWKDSHPSDFRTLVTTVDEGRASASDRKLWSSTVRALQFFGWNERRLATLLRAVGALLRFGNVRFEAKADHAVVANPDSVTLLAEMLGVAASELEPHLTHRHLEANGESMQVPYTTEQAHEACDAVVKVIYSRIFASLVQSINQQTNASDVKDDDSTVVRTISLFDMFGFESFNVNGFEQLCVNYASEKLQYKYVHDNLIRLTREYSDEGITLFDMESIDNSATIALFEGSDGILKGLDDECVRPNGTNKNFVAKLRKESKRLVENKLQGELEFTVQHFAGPVTYQADNFIGCNSDKMPLALMRVVATTSNMIIQHELNEVLKSEQLVSRSKKKTISITQSFKAQLHSLMDTMENTHVRYIRCIKPNEKLQPKKLDHNITLKQITCAGLLTAIELGRQSFPNKLSFQVIEDRFLCLMSPMRRLMLQEMPLHDRVYLMMTFLFAEWMESVADDFGSGLPFACGRTKVFFRAGAVEYVESMRHDFFSSNANKIQTWFRAQSQRRKYSAMKIFVVRIQSHSRGWKVRREVARQTAAVVRIQAKARAFSASEQYKVQRQAVILIQSITRVLVAFNMKANRERAAVLLSSLGRAMLARAQYRRCRTSSILIQSAWRRYKLCTFFKLQLQGARTIVRWWKAKCIVREEEMIVAETDGNNPLDTAEDNCEATLSEQPEDHDTSSTPTSTLPTIVDGRSTVEADEKGQNDYGEPSFSEGPAEIGISNNTDSCSSVEVAGSEKTNSDECSEIGEIKKNKEATNCVGLARSGEADFGQGQKKGTIAGGSFGNRQIEKGEDLRDKAVMTGPDDPPLEVVRKRRPSEVACWRCQLARSEEPDSENDRRIRELKEEIVQITEEADLHNQMVEAEFEDRIADYEDEVLELQKRAADLEAQNEALFTDMKTAQSNYMSTVQLLQRGIRDTTDSHKDYLAKITAQLERSNDQRKAETAKFAAELKLLRNNKDATIRELRSENTQLNQKLEDQRKLHKKCAEEASVPQEITKMARALERLISSESILSVVDNKEDSPDQRISRIEKQLSSKCRRLLYHMEDAMMYTLSEQSKQATRDVEKEVIGLQNQLVRAYEKIEELQDEKTVRRSSMKSKFFKRR